MDLVFEIEATLSDELAQLYEGLMEEFETKSAVGLEEMNRTLLQTGLVYHLTMMGGLGLIEEKKRERMFQLIDAVASETVMWDLVKHARAYWQKSQGATGTLEFEA